MVLVLHLVHRCYTPFHFTLFDGKRRRRRRVVSDNKNVAIHIGAVGLHAAAANSPAQHDSHATCFRWFGTNRSSADATSPEGLWVNEENQ